MVGMNEKEVTERIGARQASRRYRRARRKTGHSTTRPPRRVPLLSSRFRVLASRFSLFSGDLALSPGYLVPSRPSVETPTAANGIVKQLHIRSWKITNGQLFVQLFGDTFVFFFANFQYVSHFATTTIRYSSIASKLINEFYGICGRWVFS